MQQRVLHQQLAKSAEASLLEEECVLHFPPGEEEQAFPEWSPLDEDEEKDDKEKKEDKEDEEEKDDDDERDIPENELDEDDEDKAAKTWRERLELVRSTFFRVLNCHWTQNNKVQRIFVDDVRM